MNNLYDRYPELAGQKEYIEKTIEILITAYKDGNKLFLCGNGGSAADSDHIVGELMKGFLKKRPINETLRNNLKELGEEGMAAYLQEGLPAINLVVGGALTSAFANDVNPDYIYAQQIVGLGEPGDVLIGISTSGNAENVKRAVLTAKAMGMITIGLTGQCGGWLGENTDIAIKVPASETYKIQELHLPIYHWICASIEECFYKK